MRSGLRLLLLSLGLGVLPGQATSCGKPSPLEEDPATSGIPNSPFPVPSTIDCPNGTNLSYGNFGKQYMHRYCTGCHSSSLSGAGRNGAPAEINLDFAADAITFRTDMLLHAANDGAKMPPGVAVPREERALFREWLKCGAP